MLSTTDTPYIQKHKEAESERMEKDKLYKQ